MLGLALLVQKNRPFQAERTTIFLGQTLTCK